LRRKKKKTTRQRQLDLHLLQELKMPLTDKQKAFLIFKKFTGLSDDSILRNHEKLHELQKTTAEESFDSPIESRNFDPSASMETLTNINQSDVNSNAIESCTEQLMKLGDEFEVSTMVSKYKGEVNDLYRRNNSIPYHDFEQFMLRLIERDMRQNKRLCYAAISSLAKSDLQEECGTNRKWWLEFLVENFSDVAASMYDQNSGTAV